MMEVEDDTNNSRCSIPQKDEDDKLSSLPDSLLIIIISLLPINVAAATSVLSGRWRNLWTHTTHLSVSLNCDDLQYFITTVNHIISQLQSPKIHTFDLSFPYKLLRHIIFGTRTDFLVLWLHQICLRDPEVIDLNFADHPLSTNFFQIPHCLFETQSLVELQLSANIEYYNFLHDRMLSIKFPNLKKLALVLYDRHCALLGRNGTLFKACPLLEDLTLTLKFNEDCRILHILTPNLKCLRIDIEATELWNCQFVIYSPKLEKCNIFGHLMFYEFFDIPSSLQEVMISIEESSFTDFSDYISKILGLIKGISCVRSLVLENSATDLLYSISKSEALPIFKNLTHFSFSISDCIDDMPGCLDELPGCLLSSNSLKRIDIRDLECDDAGINLVQQILSNADALEQLHVSAVFCFGYEDKLREEYEFCKKLFMLSKSSVNCQIEFSGMVIIASSKDFGDDGLLSCQIKNH